MAGNAVKFFAALVLTWSTDAYGQVLIREGDEWAYFKGTAEPPADWNTLSFDDSGWERGPSRIGYGDLLDGTQLTDMSNGYLTVYIRRKFHITDVEDIALDLRMRYDDGFVAYVNGAEILRKSMDSPPGERPAHDTPALDHETNQVQEVALICSSAIASLVPGENVLAIQGHNVFIDSPDFTLLPELVLVPELCPTNVELIPSPPQNPVNVIIRWRKPTAEFAFSEISIFRDDQQLPGASRGGATSYTDREVPEGVHRYELRTVACDVTCRIEHTVLLGVDLPSFIRGDANGSSEVDISDAVWILNMLFHGGTLIECMDAADLDDDERVDINDAAYLINYQFRGGPSPSSPFPVCGADPEGDALACSSFSPCR